MVCERLSEHQNLYVHITSGDSTKPLALQPLHMIAQSEYENTEHDAHTYTHARKNGRGLND